MNIFQRIKQEQRLKRMNFQKKSSQLPGRVQHKYGIAQPIK